MAVVLRYLLQWHTGAIKCNIFNGTFVLVIMAVWYFIYSDANTGITFEIQDIFSTTV